MKKSLVCKITATRCSPCLLFSVKKKEKESLVKKGREKTHCNFWMNFSTATWTLSIISPSSPILLSHVYSAYINYTGIVYKKKKKLFATKTTRGLAQQTLPFFMPSTDPSPVIHQCQMVGCVYFLFVFLSCSSLFLSVHLQDCFIFDVWTSVAVGWGSWVCLD